MALACALLWRLGGMDKGRPGKWLSQGWGGWRDLVLPAVVGIAYTWVYDLTLGAAMLVSCSIIRMGDGAWDPEHDQKPSLFAFLTHDRSGILTKGLHGLVCGLVAPLPFLVLQHASIPHYLAFALGFGLISGALRLTRNVWIEEPGRGAWFAGILLL